MTVDIAEVSLDSVRVTGEDPMLVGPDEVSGVVGSGRIDGEGIGDDEPCETDGPGWASSLELAIGAAFCLPLSGFGGGCMSLYLERLMELWV
jgi:hypothetical protein